MAEIRVGHFVFVEMPGAHDPHEKVQRWRSLVRNLPRKRHLHEIGTFVALDVHILIDTGARLTWLTGDEVTPDLVMRAQHGDHDAFEQIAKAVVSRLYRMASLILRDPDAASDAVQEALVSAWTSLPLLRDPSALDAWLNRILVRSCYRAIRGRGRTVELQVIEMDGAAEPEEERVDTLDLIDRAFRRLTPEHRAVLVLHHRLGFRLDEAAQTLGIPLGTAKSRLNRATTAFRGALEAEGREVALVGGHPA